MKRIFSERRRPTPQSLTYVMAEVWVPENEDLPALFVGRHRDGMDREISLHAEPLTAQYPDHEAHYIREAIRRLDAYQFEEGKV